MAFPQIFENYLPAKESVICETGIAMTETLLTYTYTCNFFVPPTLRQLCYMHAHTHTHVLARLRDREIIFLARSRADHQLAIPSSRLVVSLFRVLSFPPPSPALLPSPLPLSLSISFFLSPRRARNGARAK